MNILVIQKIQFNAQAEQMYELVGDPQVVLEDSTILNEIYNWTDQSHLSIGIGSPIFSNLSELYVEHPHPDKEMPLSGFGWIVDPSPLGEVAIKYSLIGPKILRIQAYAEEHFGKVALGTGGYFNLTASTSKHREFQGWLVDEGIKYSIVDSEEYKTTIDIMVERIKQRLNG